MIFVLFLRDINRHQVLQRPGVHLAHLSSINNCLASVLLWDRAKSTSWMCVQRGHQTSGATSLSM